MNIGERYKDPMFTKNIQNGTEKGFLILLTEGGPWKARHDAITAANRKFSQSLLGFDGRSFYHLIYY